MKRQQGELFDGRYEIERYLGGGGMGIVYKARELGAGRVVVIKCIRPELLHGDPEQAAQFLERFTFEAEAMKRIHHPGIVRLYDHKLTDTGTPYLVTEYIDGDHLAYPEIHPDAPLPVLWGAWLPFLDAVDQLLEILDAVHEAGVIHRDLKPENIMLQRSWGGAWLARILDFGLAKIGLDDEGNPQQIGNLTQAGAGTMLYMAPEQFMAPDQISHRTDQYAIGLMAYRALAGSHAFDADEDNSLPSLFTRSQHSVDALGPPVPRTIAEVIARATRRPVHERFPTTRAFREALQSAIQEASAQHSLPIPHNLQPARTAHVPSLAETGTALPTPDTGAGPDLPPWLDTALVILPDGALYDEVWERLLEPTLAAIELPELGRHLQPLRMSWLDLSSSLLDADVLERLEFSRLTLWETTDCGPDVMRALLHAHRAGLIAPLRLLRAAPPAELVHLPATRYDCVPAHYAASQDALEHQVQAMLRRRWRTHAQTLQWQQRNLSTPRLLAATRALIEGHPERAREALDAATRDLPDAPILRFRRALLAAPAASDHDDWSRIADDLTAVTEAIPEHGPAWRELGVACGKLGQRARALQCFDRATQLTPWDHDAWAAYGGVLKKQAAQLTAEARRSETRALECYQHGVEVSDGHPYPLLNALRMEMLREGRIALDPTRHRHLEQAIETRREQARSRIDAPWCDFDLAEALLYLGRADEATRALSDAGPIAGWALETFLGSLTGLRDAGIQLQGLPELIAWVEARRVAAS